MNFVNRALLLVLIVGLTGFLIVNAAPKKPGHLLTENTKDGESKKNNSLQDLKKSQSDVAKYDSRETQTDASLQKVYVHAATQVKNVSAQTEQKSSEISAPLGQKLRKQRDENAHKLLNIQALLKAVEELEKTYGKFLTAPAKKILNDLKVELNSSLTGIKKLIDEIDEHLNALEIAVSKLSEEAKNLFSGL